VTKTLYTVSNLDIYLFSGGRKEIRIAKVKLNSSGKKKSKIDYCLYCRKKQTKIWRHWGNARREKSTYLRNRGNYAHNNRTRARGAGTLHVAKARNAGDPPKRAADYRM